MRQTAKQDCGDRLSRIEGQARGISRMIVGDRCCIDILARLRVGQAALRKGEGEVLNDYVEHRV